MQRPVLVVLFACVAALPAKACGPDFPELLLDDRSATLGQLPEGVFADEAATLVATPNPAFKPVDRDEWHPNEVPTRESLERAWLGGDAARADSLRAQGDAAKAYAAGSGLPEEARRYLAGAAAFTHGDPAEAARRFASVLELPPADRNHVSVWAAYMLGRSEAQADPPRAAQAFQQVRALVAGGAADPLGLAADSYGEEAQLALVAGKDAAAVALYAQQAALGSRSGRDSLLQVARALVADPSRLDHGIADPLTQHLIALYLLTRGGELGIEPAYSDPGGKPAAKNAATTFLDAVEQRGLAQVEGAGRLAALAYRSGRYDLAARFAAKGRGGLAAWVRAKLALRAGDAGAAAAAYAEAAKAFPVATAAAKVDDDRRAQTSYCRVEGEAGTLALVRGEYTTALEHLYASAAIYWLDAAWVAERVLTLDELKAFVDGHAAAPVPSPTSGDATYLFEIPPAARLRALLARRLLRDGRDADALAYFDEPAMKEHATAFAAARKAAQSGGRIERARQAYAAAAIARADGIQLLGYELDPDYQTFGGEYEYGGHLDTPQPLENGALPLPHPALKISTQATAGEHDRAAASAAKPDLRFHYRYVAADLAAGAADLVPQRSQAYAALLCHASGWVVARNPAAAAVYYQRYVAHGPHVAWAENFGNQCEEPDFDGAARRLQAERIAAARHAVRKSAPYLLGGSVLVVVLAGVRRRRRAARATAGSAR